jgi:hypothetical protein
MKKIKITKSPNNKVLTLTKWENGYIIRIDMKELKDFLQDEYTDIKVFDEVK